MNKNQVLNNTKTVIDEKGIKKVDARTNIKIEDIVKYVEMISSVEKKTTSTEGTS